jgi:hypothetical protein
MTAKDYPFDDVVAAANEIITNYPNADVFQKFTCNGCGARLTMDVANAFYETGGCDRCSTVTDIKKRGCNYMVRLGVKRA